MSNPMTVLRALASLLVLTAACGPDGPDAASPLGATVRDSAGITIVENAALPDDASLPWTVGPEPTVEIGVLEGSEEYQLFRVRGAHRLPDGRIAVVNAGSQEIRLYGADGVHLESWGGRGEGPGEFMSPVSISWWPGDSLAVWDARLRRLSIFTEHGVLGRTLTFADLEGMPAPAFSHVSADGNAVVRVTVPPQGGFATGLLRTPVAVALVDGDGTLVAPLGTHPGREGFIKVDEGSIEIVTLPFYRDIVIRAAGREDIISPTDRFELRFWAADGRLSRIVRVDQAPRLITDAELTAELDRRLASAPEEARPRIRSTFEEIPVQDTLPAFSHLVVDGGDNVWVRPFRLPGDEGPEHWLVLDPAGQTLGHVALPTGLTVYEIGGDYILGSSTDDLEVERVQVWPLQRR